MPLLPRSVLAAIAALALGAVAACGPRNANTTVAPYAVGSAASVEYGTVLAVRANTVAGTRSGFGAGVGAVSGGFVGSTIGQGWRERTIAGLAAALVGGILGAAIEEGATGGVANDFTIRTDGGRDIVVTQTNEEGLQAGERVQLIYGGRIRLARAAAPPPPAAPGRYSATAAPTAGDFGALK